MPQELCWKLTTGFQETKQQDRQHHIPNPEETQRRVVWKKFDSETLALIVLFYPAAHHSAEGYGFKVGDILGLLIKMQP